MIVYHTQSIWFNVLMLRELNQNTGQQMEILIIVIISLTIFMSVLFSVQDAHSRQTSSIYWSTFQE